MQLFFEVLIILIKNINMLIDYLVKKPIIESKNLILRPFQNSDVKDIEEWSSDISIYKYWGKKPGKYDLNPKLLLNKKEKPTKSFHLYIFLKQEKKVVGDIYIYLIENNIKAKIAIRINKNFHRKGIGTEAINSMVKWIFDNTEINTIWTDVDIDNEASIKLLEKTNFKLIKTMENSKMVSTITNYYIYQISK